MKKGNRCYRKSFEPIVDDPLVVVRINVVAREREATQVRSDLYRRETGTNPILIRIPRNFRALYEISSMHLRTVISAFDFQFRSIIFRLILTERSHERIRQICLSDFVQIYHRYLATCVRSREPISDMKKKPLRHWIGLWFLLEAFHTSGYYFYSQNANVRWLSSTRNEQTPRLGAIELSTLSLSLFLSHPVCISI